MYSPGHFNVLLSISLQEANILAGVTDSIQALYPFLKYHEDLLMDVLRKVNKMTV